MSATTRKIKSFFSQAFWVLFCVISVAIMAVGQYIIIVELLSNTYDPWVNWTVVAVIALTLLVETFVIAMGIIVPIISCFRSHEDPQPKSAAQSS